MKIGCEKNYSYFKEKKNCFSITFYRKLQEMFKSIGI